MVASSILLGAAFISIGYFVSAISRDRGTAAGIAVGIWLLFVLIYDMALLGVLAATQGRAFSSEMLNVFLLLNPADSYRLFNLSAFAEVSQFSGMAGLAGGVALSAGTLLAALGAWVVIPLALAATVFSRREL